LVGPFRGLNRPGRALVKVRERRVRPQSCNHHSASHMAPAIAEPTTHRAFSLGTQQMSRGVSHPERPCLRTRLCDAQRRFLKSAHLRLDLLTDLQLPSQDRSTTQTRPTNGPIDWSPCIHQPSTQSSGYQANGTFAHIAGNVKQMGGIVSNSPRSRSRQRVPEHAHDPPRAVCTF
jgi:hypothetical protein